jgi:peptide/nickel transport system substrate-binding protein
MDRFLQVTTRKAAFENLDTYEATDDATVIFTLKSPSVGFLSALAFPLAYPGIIPREVVETISELNVELEHLVGTGPYTAVEFVPDQVLRFERFDDYASLGGPVNGLSGGKVAYFDEIQMINVPEAGGQVAGLETAEYDFADAAPTTDFDRLEESPDTQTAIYQNSDLWTFYLNHNDPLIQNLKFREALRAAIDMEEILLAITNGRKEFYTLDASFFFPGTPWHNDEGADLYNINDPELAKQLLDESGYAGEEVILITNTTYEGIYKAIVAVDEQLKTKLGLKTKVEVLDWAGQIERTDAPGGWHMANTSFISAPTYGPGNWSQFMETGQSSWGYSNPDMDAVFDAFRAATTDEEQIQAAHDIQRIQYETVGQIKIGNTASFVALREEIKNYIHWYEPRFWSIWREE